jgi:hypothetical protein
MWVFRVRLGYLTTDVRSRVSRIYLRFSYIQMKGASVMIYKPSLAERFLALYLFLNQKLALWTRIKSH